MAKLYVFFYYLLTPVMTSVLFLASRSAMLATRSSSPLGTWTRLKLAAEADVVRRASMDEGRRERITRVPSSVG